MSVALAEYGEFHTVKATVRAKGVDRHDGDRVLVLDLPNHELMLGSVPVGIFNDPRLIDGTVVVATWSHPASVVQNFRGVQYLIAKIDTIEVKSIPPRAWTGRGNWVRP